MLYEANVIFIEMTDVVDVIFEHGNALDTHSEGKSAVNLGVDSAVAQNIRMNHSCAVYLKPALALSKTAALAAAHKAGDIHLG